MAYATPRLSTLSPTARTRLGFLRVASEIVATETSGAVRHAADAFGRGFAGGARSAGFDGSATQQVVRLKCRSCGFLESEDARFCSKCGEGV